MGAFLSQEGRQEGPAERLELTARERDVEAERACHMYRGLGPRLYTGGWALSMSLVRA